jgi:beta-lactam-binding protein with PASTA domain
MYTLQDAINEKKMMDANLYAKIDKQAAEEKRIADILRNNPQIGVLIKKGKTVYYTCKLISYGNVQVTERKDPADLI